MGCWISKTTKTNIPTTDARSKERLHCYRQIFLGFTQGLNKALTSVSRLHPSWFSDSDHHLSLHLQQRYPCLTAVTITAHCTFATFSDHCHLASTGVLWNLISGSWFPHHHSIRLELPPDILMCHVDALNYHQIS